MQRCILANAVVDEESYIIIRNDWNNFRKMNERVYPKKDPTQKYTNERADK